MMDDLVGRFVNLRLTNETEIADRIGLPPTPSSRHKTHCTLTMNIPESVAVQTRTSVAMSKWRTLASRMVLVPTCFLEDRNGRTDGVHTITVETVTSEEFERPMVVYDGPVIEMFPRR